MMIKRVFSVCVALLLSFLLTVSVFAGSEGDEEAMGPWCEAIFTGTTRGPVCDVHLQLYHWLSADPMEDFRADMVYGFKVVISNGAGQVLDEIWFPGGEGGYSMDFTLTEPGDYYFQVWSGRGFAQGRSISPEVYDTSPHYVQVVSEAEMFPEITMGDEMAFAFMGICDEYPEEPDLAVRTFLETLQYGNWTSEENIAAYKTSMEPLLTDAYRPAYELFLKDEGYQAMAVTPLGEYDTAILYEDEFWKQEAWRSLRDTGELPPFELEGSGDVYEGEDILTDGALPEEDDTAQDGASVAGVSPAIWIAIGSGTAVAVVLLLLKKKK